MTVDLIGPASSNSVTTRPARTISRGTADTFFQDCSGPDAKDGTAFGADFFNDILAQMRTAMRSAGIVLDNADDMLWRAMQSIGLRYGVDIGAAGHLTVTYAPPVSLLYAGLPLLIQADADCPGATDFTPNGLAIKSLTWPDGTALAAGDYKAGSILLVVYDGTKWQLLSKYDTEATHFIVPYILATGTASAITAAFSPAFTALYAGDIFSVQLASAIAGATTISPNGLGPYALVDADGHALTSGSGAVGADLFCQFDGTSVRVLSGLSSPTTFPAPGAIGSYICVTNGWTGDYTLGTLNNVTMRMFQSGDTDVGTCIVAGTWAYVGEADPFMGLRVA
jgi:hypothetical protein